MSGSTGADRIKTRKDFATFVRNYTKLLRKYPGFVSLKPSGSYNSNKAKTSFGDIDLIVQMKGTDKKKVKIDLVKWMNKQSDKVIVSFTSDRYKGKRALNTGEIVTVRFHDARLGYSVQVDNIISLSKTEAVFKGSFLDLPAEKQGLILGLVKTATIEADPQQLFRRMRITNAPELQDRQEYAFNLSSKELQLRLITYEGTEGFKEKSRENVWTSTNFNDLKSLLFQYDLSKNFEDLIVDVKRKLKNPRSPKRIGGIFRSMVSIKSGEVGTEKGEGKQAAINLVNKMFGEEFVMFRDFLDTKNFYK
jgi:hypothetical protein